MKMNSTVPMKCLNDKTSYSMQHEVDLYVPST